MSVRRPIHRLGLSRYNLGVSAQTVTATYFLKFGLIADDFALVLCAPFLVHAHVMRDDRSLLHITVFTVIHAMEMRTSTFMAITWANLYSAVCMVAF